jgi:hypothetical protein
MRWDTTGSVAFDFVRFYWHGQGARCARACEAYLTRRKFLRALPKDYECFEINIQTVSTAAPPRHTGAPAGAYIFNLKTRLLGVEIPETLDIS